MFKAQSYARFVVLMAVLTRKQVFRDTRTFEISTDILDVLAAPIFKIRTV
jgi:hypothetical protein